MSTVEKVGLGVISVVLLALGAWWGRPEHPHFWFEEIPAYGALLGFLGAVLLILLAKGLLAPALRRGEEADES